METYSGASGGGPGGSCELVSGKVTERGTPYATQRSHFDANVISHMYNT